MQDDNVLRPIRRQAASLLETLQRAERDVSELLRSLDKSIAALPLRGCSFCGRAYHRGYIGVSARHASICEECVRLSQDVITEGKTDDPSA